MAVISYIFIFLSTIVFSVVWFLHYIMGNNNFYEDSYMFMHSIKANGSLTTFLYSAKSCLLIFSVILLALILINTFVFNTAKKKFIFSTITILVSICLLLMSVHFGTYLINSFLSTNIYEKYYVDTNSVKITFPKKKKNLIIIYLEGMEASLFSKSNGGAFEKSRIPELESIALNNTNFSNTEKLGGAYTLNNSSCTIFSLVTSTSGTPVYARLFYSYNDKNPYMRNVKSLGNVLRENGYNLGLIQGSSIKFSATDYYLKENGDFEVFDDDTAKSRGYIDKNYSVWWGMEDKKTLEYSKKEILNMAKKDKPFAYIIFTTDTHFPDGYIDETCEEVFDEYLSNSYACSSKIVGNYIEWIKSQDFYKNTTIFIMGDHTIKQESFYKEHKDYNRVNYNAIINSSVEGNNKNRQFSQFDMYPTILASIGAKIDGDRIGFGVNLFSKEKTMIEILGKEKFDNEMFKKSDYYNKHILSNDK